MEYVTELSTQPRMRYTAPRSMKNVGNDEGRRRGGGKRSHLVWCREPVTQSDPGDPEHHTLSPPSGEHVGENTPTYGLPRTAAKERGVAWV